MAQSPVYMSSSSDSKVVDYSSSTKSFEVQFPYSQNLVDRVKSAFSNRSFDPSRKIWLVPANPLSTDELLTFSSQNDFCLSEQVKTFIQAASARRQKNLLNSYAQSSTLTIEGLGAELRPYQLAGVEYALRNKRIIMGDEMGLGKTPQSLATMQAAKAFPVVVVSPAILKNNWLRETQKWLPGKSVMILSGKSPVQIPEADVVIINYDILPKWVDELVKVHFHGIILDEAHYVKNYKAARTQSVAQLAKGIQYRLALTGTPVINRPADLISILKVINRLNDFGGFEGFVDLYCDPHTEYGHLNINGASNLGELNTRLREVAYFNRRKADVLLALPPIQRSTIYLDVSECRQDYDTATTTTVDYIHKLKLDSHSNLQMQPADYQNILVYFEKMRQAVAFAKVDAIVQWAKILLEDPTQKLLLYALHLDVIDALAQELKNSCGTVVITGKVDPSARQDRIDQFQNDPNTRLMIANLKVAGTGLNLTAANVVAHVELDWTAAPHDQGDARAHRIGQTETVFSYYLAAEKTIDEKMLRMIEKKRALAATITGASGGDSESSSMREIIDEFIAENKK